MVGDTVVRAGLVGLALLPGCNFQFYGDLCTEYRGLDIAYTYETDCMGDTATGRLALHLPATKDGLPDISVLTQQARAGGLNAQVRGSWVASTGESCDNPLDAGQAPWAELDGPYLDIYPGPIGSHPVDQTPFQCGYVSSSAIPVDTTRTCHRSLCPPAGGLCEQEHCSLRLRT